LGRCRTRTGGLFAPKPFLFTPCLAEGVVDIGQAVSRCPQMSLDGWGRRGVRAKRGEVLLGKRPVLLLPALATMFMVSWSFASVANAYNVDQDGRVTGANNVDGSYAQVIGNSFDETADQCVIYSVLSYDSTAPRQLESGLVRCSSPATIDGSCPGGHTFVERWDGSNYRCVSGYSFTNGTEYDATTYRNSGTQFLGSINGASNGQSGFGANDNIQGYAWGEASGGSTCPSPASGNFTTWQRYVFGVGWSDVTGSSIFRGVLGNMSGTPCWPTVSATDSSGGFGVS
jgi:hypothetical protein